jgi:hypothetical protein
MSAKGGHQEKETYVICSVYFHLTTPDEFGRILRRGAILFLHISQFNINAGGDICVSDSCLIDKIRPEQFGIISI